MLKRSIYTAGMVLVSLSLYANSDWGFEDPDPEWYVAPIERSEVKAIRKAAAAQIDSIQTFDINHNLVKVAIYEHGDTTRTMIWTVNPDGSREGLSKEEAGSNATTSFTATYTWDNATNNWKGSGKTERTYEANKEIARINYIWLNNAWVADTKQTWAYESGRETEYISYTRDAITNDLVYATKRVRTYNSAGKNILDIQYGSYVNNEWVGSSKKVYDFDAAGNQILYENYGAYTDNAWVGTSKNEWEYVSGKKVRFETFVWNNGVWGNAAKETWTFNTAGKQTLHEKATWSAGEWSVTLREILGYDEAGNNNLIENCSYTNGVQKGTKKEEYTYNSAKKKVLTIAYKWSNNAWEYNTKNEVDFQGSNKILDANYTWKNGEWVGDGERVLNYYQGAHLVGITIQKWSTTAKNWVNATRDTAIYSGNYLMQAISFAWENDQWKGTERTDYHYFALNLTDTVKTFAYNGAEWVPAQRTVKTYDAKKNNILTHNADWSGSAWVMTSMEKLDVCYDGNNRKTRHATYTCGGDSIWVGVKKDTTAYATTGKKIYEAQYTSWSDTGWVASYKIEYTYDEANREILIQRFNCVNNKWVVSGTSAHEYDEQGRLIVEVSNSTKYIYTYDASNREIKKVEQNYENGNWANSRKAEKEYNGTKLVKNNSYSWLEGQWKFDSRSESYYDDDADAKLRREINGTWSNGALVNFTENRYFYTGEIALYTISFLNYDGSELEVMKLGYGEMPTTAIIPERPEDDKFTYTFIGWSPEIESVTGDTEYTAFFQGTEKSTTNINNILTNNKQKGIYSITGNYLGENIGILPQGVYIVNGEKVIR